MNAPTGCPRPNLASRRERQENRLSETSLPGYVLDNKHGSSSAAARTPWPPSQSVSARSAGGSLPKTRVALAASLRPGSHRRTVAVTCILWTSMPAARGTATCIESLEKQSRSMLYTPFWRKRVGDPEVGHPPRGRGSFCRSSRLRKRSRHNSGLDTGSPGQFS